MATTIVPKPGKPGKGVTVKDIQEATYTWLKFAQGDADKSGDMDAFNYNQGMVDAYSDVLWRIETPKLPTSLHKSRILTAAVVVAVAATVVAEHYRKDNQPDA